MNLISVCLTKNFTVFKLDSSKDEKYIFPIEGDLDGNYTLLNDLHDLSKVDYHLSFLIPPMLTSCLVPTAEMVISDSRILLYAELVRFREYYV